MVQSSTLMHSESVLQEERRNWRSLLACAVALGNIGLQAFLLLFQNGNPHTHGVAERVALTIVTLGASVMFIFIMQILDVVMSSEDRATHRSEKQNRNGRNGAIVRSLIDHNSDLASKAPSRVPRTPEDHGAHVGAENLTPIRIKKLACFLWRLQLQIPEAHSTVLLSGLWSLDYVLYASVVTRHSCFFDHGRWTKCDAWHLSRVPFWLYALDAVVLWSFSLRILLRCLFIRRLSNVDSLEFAILMLQLPLGLLGWQTFWQEIGRTGGGSIVHTSLQMGWLHMLLLFKSRMVEVAANLVHLSPRDGCTCFLVGVAFLMLACNADACGVLPAHQTTAQELYSHSFRQALSSA